jgi:hypothetical protein
VNTLTSQVLLSDSAGLFFAPKSELIVSTGFFDFFLESLDDDDEDDEDELDDSSTNEFVLNEGLGLAARFEVDTFLIWFSTSICESLDDFLD